MALQAAPLAHLAYPRARMEIGNPLTTQGRMLVHHREQLTSTFQFIGQTIVAPVLVALV
jgi:hypothetical protein